jgi:hypothetical protein
MPIPCYPDFVPLEIGLKEILYPRLSLTIDGVSEFTFCGLYLFRNRYKYHISRFGEGVTGRATGVINDEKGFIISGQLGGKNFFMTPCEAPNMEILRDLFKTHDYWKNIPDSVLSTVREKLQKEGIVLKEDRDNFDYLYYRTDLAELAGKKYHKKKNHVNHFLHTYPDHESRQLNVETLPAAFEILERWRNEKSILGAGEDGDFIAAKEALELFNSLPMRGAVYYVEKKPAAFCIGESIARGRMFAIHFEKGIDEYKGIYQFMNQAFAVSLPRFFTHINREQDLGNEGLRQAKMTYRPCAFVQKYTGTL